MCDYKNFVLPLSGLTFEVPKDYDWEMARSYVDRRIDLEDMVPFEYDQEDTIVWVEPSKLRQAEDEMAKRS